MDYLEILGYSALAVGVISALIALVLRFKEEKEDKELEAL